MSLIVTGHISIPGKLSLAPAFTSPPTWVTVAGNIGSFQQNTSVSIQLVASGPAIVSYGVQSGALPGGVTLNTVTGLISGTAPSIVGVSQTFTFTIRVTNAGNLFADRTFNIIVGFDTPVWVTAAGSLGTFNMGSFVDVTPSATDSGGTITGYTISVGTLPAGLSLNQASAEITGTASNVTTDTTSTFTLRVTNAYGNFADRQFSITIAFVASVVTWVTTAGSVATTNPGQTTNVQLVATTT